MPGQPPLMLPVAAASGAYPPLTVTPSFRALPWSLRILFLALAALLTACRTPPSSVRFVVYQGAQAPALAQSLGFLERQGLRVDLTETAGTAKAMEALLAGSADIILGTYEQALQMNAKGRAVQAFYLLNECHCLALVAIPQSKVRALEGLRGATVGVAAPGGSMQFFVTHLAAGQGIPPAAFSVASIGAGPQAAVAIERAKVDAGVVLFGSYLALKQRNPQLRVLAETFTREGARRALGTDRYPAGVLLARAEWLAANRNTAENIARAMQDTVRWMQSHTIDEVRAQLPAAGRLPDPAVERELLRTLIPLYSPNGRIDPEAAHAVQTLLSRSDPAVDAVVLERTYTNELIPR